MSLKYELFSNWLFIWFIFYYYGFISASPLIFYIIAFSIIIINGISVMKIRFEKKVLKYILYNFLAKIVPIFIMFKFPLFNEDDLLFGFILLYIYVITLLYFNKNPIEIYLNVRKKYKNLMT
jgi:hypothetical protein